jgi:hypothetical protein
MFRNAFAHNPKSPALMAVASCWIAASIQGQTLYDGSQGTLPEAQGWSFGAVNFGSVVELATNGSALLDTTSSTLNSDGWSQIAAPGLDRFAGFSLLFTAKLNAETHNNANRAGFSCIVLGNDTNGIELGFWTTTIFAQSDNPLFTHAEDTAFITTNGYVNYSLTMLATNYLLSANGTTILTGPVRNYTAFNGPVNPYRTPNFLFFGDDTTSASGSVNVQKIQLVLPPALSASNTGIISWTGVSNVTYTVDTSTNLIAWTSNATVNSTANAFYYTNSNVHSTRYFRVSYP